MLEKAIEIATKAHRGQVDKAGEPYILHPLRVMLAMDDLDAKICAVLHDTVEDSDVTLADLKALGFSQIVTVALDCLTKRPNEDYASFISRILEDELACRVKLADLNDNLNLTRLRDTSMVKESRIKNYISAVNRIETRLNMDRMV